MYKLEMNQHASLCPSTQIQLQYTVLILSNLENTIDP